MDEQILDSSLVENAEFSFEKRLEEIKEYGYSVNIIKYINDAFSIFGKNAGGFIGYFLLVFIMAILLSVISRIPYAGSLIQQILSTCLVVGFYLVANRISTNKIYSFSVFFSGFEFFVPLALKSLIVIAIIFSLFIPFILFGISTSFQIIDIQYFIQTFQYFSSSLIFFLILIILLILIIMAFWIFANLNIVIAKQSAWKALEMSRKVTQKKIFSILLFGLSLLILNIFGAILLLIGLIVTIPISFIAIYCAWEDIMITQGKEIS